MTGTSRKLGLALALSALAPTGAFAATWTPAAPPVAQDIQATFEQGVDLLRRGRDEEALRAFETVLAADPSHEAAYELFKSTEHQVWLDILARQGDFELIAKRLMGLASMGRLERRDDAEAIRALVAQLVPDDPISRLSATRQLAAEHGEYAVPYMLPALANAGDEAGRVAVIQSLTEMGLDVVPPLVAALGADDAYLRRNVALTLGRISDPRAVAMLAHVAANDEDTGARQAAQEALAKLGAQGVDAAAAFVKLGQAYLERADSVLAAHLYSDVVWRWEGRALAKIGVPREVYAEEMARSVFAHALAVDPSSSTALAGYVRAQVGEVAKLMVLADSGRDVGELLDHARQGSVAVGYAGVDAADAALQSAVASRDISAAIGLVQAVKAMAAKPTPGLQAALGSDDGALRSFAAIALAHVAVDSHSAASANVVEELARAVSREVMRIAFVIDADAGRSASIAAGLRAQGMMVTNAGTGGMGLAMLSRLPGLDVVLVAESLPDLTAHQVLTELADSPRYAQTPRVLITADADRGGELHGDRVQGMVVEGDVSGVPELLDENLNRDREEADQLSRAAAVALAELAAANADITAALDALAGTLATRPDEVAIPSSHALERAGTGRQIPALVGVVADSTRFDEVRAAAASAIAMIVARGAGSVPAEGLATLRGVAESDAPLEVRQAAAIAVGASASSAADRAALVHSATTAGDTQ